MYNSHRKGISIKAVLDKRRVRKSELYPIRIRVTYRRVQKYYVTNLELSVEDWEKLSKTKLTDLVLLREEVRENFNLISNIIDELSDKQEFSFDNLKKKIIDRTSPSRNIDNNLNK